MNSARHIYTLIKKDLLLEVRQQYSFYGILLYIMATIFVLYMTIREPEAKGLEWIVLGDSIVYLHKCSCEKFFTRNPRSHALFLFHRKPTGFYSCKTCVQLSANVVNEFPEHFALSLFF
jgi:hypothetical protein